MKVLVSKKTGRYYYSMGKEDYHCREGIITKEDLDSGNNFVESTLGHSFLIFEANNYDFSKKFKVGPQLITKKDLGYIMSRTGLNRNSNVVEAGSGSGAATAFFAGICNFVKSYDVRDDHIKVANRNLEFIGLSDFAKFENADINVQIEKEENGSIDMLFLDMLDTHKVLEKDLSAVKNGAFIVCYVPSIIQVQDITSVISTRKDLYLEEITEVIIRNWKVWDKIARPNHRKEIDHTAFLVFIRKI